MGTWPALSNMKDRPPPYFMAALYCPLQSVCPLHTNQSVCLVHPHFSPLIFTKQQQKQQQHNNNTNKKYPAQQCNFDKHSTPLSFSSLHYIILLHSFTFLHKNITQLLHNNNKIYFLSSTYKHISNVQRPVRSVLSDSVSGFPSGFLLFWIRMFLRRPALHCGIKTKTCERLIAIGQR